MKRVLRLIRQNLWTVFSALLFVGVLYWLSTLIDEENIRLFLTKAGFWAPLIFILLNLLTLIIAPLSGTPFILAGFYAFGKQVVIFVSIANFLASIINFLIARRWGRKIVQKFIGQENMSEVDRLAKDYGLMVLFVLRIFQGGLHDFISYAAGLSPLSFFSYLLVSSLGMIPGTVLWYRLSLEVDSPIVFTILTLGLVITFSTIFILLGLAVKLWQKRKL